MATPAQILYDEIRASGGSIDVQINSPAYNIAELNPSAFTITPIWLDAFRVTLSIVPGVAFDGASSTAGGAPKTGNGNSSNSGGGSASWGNLNLPNPTQGAADFTKYLADQNKGLSISTTTLLLIGALVVVVVMSD